MDKRKDDECSSENEKEEVQQAEQLWLGIDCGVHKHCDHVEVREEHGIDPDIVDDFEEFLEGSLWGLVEFVSVNAGDECVEEEDAQVQTQDQVG